jgi:hypothetical protein
VKCYVTLLDGEAALLPFFVRHYLRLGATSFPVLIYGTQSQMEAACETIAGNGGLPQPVGVFDATTFSAKRREAEIRKVHPAGEWAFFCDLDEFCELTAEQVAAHVKSDLPYVAGRWLDRVGRGGKLLEVCPDRPLEEQFPLKGTLRQNWKMGAAVYVLSPFAPMLHHPNVCSIGRKHWPQSCVTVHHFKWQANVLPRLRARMVRIALVRKLDTPWARRVRAMIAHLEEHDGVDPRLLSPAGNILGI